MSASLNCEERLFEPEMNTDTRSPASTESRASSQAQALSLSLLSQCRALLHELTSFQLYLTGLSRPNLVELRQFKSAVQAELRSLEKLCESANKAAEEDEQAKRAECTETGVVRGDDEDGKSSGGEGDAHLVGAAERKVLHSLRSSNLPFFSTVWKVAKTACTGLVAFNKKFYWQEVKKKKKLERDDYEMENGFPSLELQNGGVEVGIDESEVAELVRLKRNVIVDIVADHGEEWVKVSTITPTRLLFELARQGWELDSDDEEEYRLRNYDSEDDGDDDIVELVKLAVDMKKAAAQTRVRYKHPRIRFILPKVTEGQAPHTDRIIHEIRKAGVTVECGTIPENPLTGGAKQLDPRSLEATFSSLLPSPYPQRTSTLNVDCTLLLALVSDLSHYCNIAHSTHHHRAITRQIELEAEKPLVPSELWPAMGDKDLLCTTEAAQRMREIVDTIGTQAEKTRTKLLMGEMDEHLERQQLISRFQELSDHKVPTDWRIPIRVVESREVIRRGFEDGRLPPVARKIANHLSDINASVFVYGWSTGLMTISSNRTVAKQIETMIEKNRGDDDDLRGPFVWVCDTARSLVGKEKNRKS
ncbi:hypothetical protein D8B26_007729 [Coccidioides posadasii str. Silveira]|uniref:Uncharacterized protein n=2 Tax=Coccidioides posadasii TaxID=199306 RepID=E9D2U1_COCPS|nr:hypothetical protein CPC735_017230 [Coccidioides posadasii C735 delta SOWgp]EER25121.1 hypothetical protein CPC735_017230 [Coccidioides posadasii C735 delta SOWgp]EFW19505.1 conserved hypothetical protein [Coccidioides posadasii str. Silveira]QVM13113.1 hypothetical protein D8B26_007729 [Coccidioides posadasii str. Silveira]|eukprot:XP_003067266.1 hypothetical protein CPC735_017230 [Coccidioides posadasii C735 delta SOWgp]